MMQSARLASEAGWPGHRRVPDIGLEVVQARAVGVQGVFWPSAAATSTVS
jgi:hypothetical protein